jgi:putative lipoprotein
MAQMQTLSVTVNFRERIALPPDALLDVHILQMADADTQGGTIAAQRFAIAGVPMTVSLIFDPEVIVDGAPYALDAAIRAPYGPRMFRGAMTLDGLGGGEAAAIEMLLTMLPDAETTTAVSRRISGVAWTVTEVFGEAWPNDDPATLVIDDEMNVSAFGGCNRFRGQLQSSGRGLAFPENMAGTMMACPDEIEALERRFLAALMLVSDYVRYGEGVVLMDAEGRAVLHFVETPE